MPIRPVYAINHPHTTPATARMAVIKAAVEISTPLSVITPFANLIASGSMALSHDHPLVKILSDKGWVFC